MRWGNFLGPDPKWDGGWDGGPVPLSHP